MMSRKNRTSLFLAVLSLGLGFAGSVAAADTPASAEISEFLADNQHGLKDDDGERSGWIEIGNRSSATLHLAGWFLTDSTNDLTKWRFPRVSLLPDKSLVVFASGKNRTNDLLHLHTNFRLDKQGGYLALVGPGSNVVSEFAPAYPKQAPDVSYGRVRGESALLGSFQRPTPGKPNASRGTGFAPPVAFSRPGGTFTAPFTVHLSCGSASNRVIRYTMDGKLPTTRSSTYVGPLLITNSVQIRARAYEEHLLPGPPQSETYLLLETNIQTLASSLPLLVMDSFGADVPTSARSSFVHLSFFEPVNGKTSLTNAPALSTRGGYHSRGSSTAGLPQTSYAVQFLDEFDQERSRSPLGLPEDSDWVLYAPNGYDPVLIHNPFVHQLSRDMGRYSPRTRFLEVYVVRNAGPVSSTHYQGIYVLEEKIKTGKHRVNIDRLGPEDLKMPEVSGGYLLKFDRPGPGEGGLAAGGAGMIYVEPKEQVIRIPQRAAQRLYLQRFFDKFEQALNGPKWMDPAEGYRKYVDVDAAIDFHVLEVLSGNVDAMVLSTYFQIPRNGKIVFGPHWDFDRALGSTDGRDDNPRQWNTGPFFGGAWWPRLFSDPDFWQQWVDRWQDLRRTFFSLANLNRLIDSLAAEVREAQPREYEKWNLQPRGGSYQSEIDLMKAWLSNRIDFIDSQLVQPPRLTEAGGSLLNLSAATNVTIYYTLDGSDPRLSQGAISTNALLYTKPVPLSANARVLARARNPDQRQMGGPPVSTPWSGPITARVSGGAR